MKNNYIIIGAALGFLGVVLGAFGAHSLKPYIAADLLETYKTGVLYHLIHAAVILAVGISGRAAFFLPALFLTIGVVLFSFSLYVYSLTAFKPLALITPLGGISFLIGWLWLFAAAIRTRKEL